MYVPAREEGNSLVVHLLGDMKSYALPNGTLARAYPNQIYQKRLLDSNGNFLSVPLTRFIKEMLHVPGVASVTFSDYCELHFGSKPGRAQKRSIEGIMQRRMGLTNPPMLVAV